MGSPHPKVDRWEAQRWVGQGPREVGSGEAPSRGRLASGASPPLTGMSCLVAQGLPLAASWGQCKTASEIVVRAVRPIITGTSSSPKSQIGHRLDPLGVFCPSITAASATLPLVGTPTNWILSPQSDSVRGEVGEPEVSWIGE